METYKYTLDKYQYDAVINSIAKELGAHNIEELEKMGITSRGIKGAEGWKELSVTAEDEDTDDAIYDAMREALDDDPESASIDNHNFIEYCVNAPSDVNEKDLFKYIAQSIVDDTSYIDVYVPNPTFGRGGFRALDGNDMKLEVLVDISESSWEVTHEIDEKLREQKYPFESEYVSAIKIDAKKPYYLIYERDIW